jgi:hypothetical protein
VAGKLKLTFKPNTRTFYIDGPAVTASVSIANGGSAFTSGVFLRAEITQGTATRRAANVPTKCSPLALPGSLPTGDCSMTINTAALTTGVGSGTLGPGPAVMVLRLMVQTTPLQATELDSKSTGIDLLATPRITTLTLTPTTLVIGGAPANYTATLNNPGPALSGVLLQGIMVQGTTRRAAGGLSVTCGGGIGVLPTGSCTINFSAVASNTTGGSGTLVPGAGVFELSLIQSTGSGDLTFDTKTVNVTLANATPTITNIAPVSSFVVLDKPGTFTDFTATVVNASGELSVVDIQGWIRQGTARRAAGGTDVTCGPAVGTLPNGTCQQANVIIADNVSSGGSGTLVPGPATFELELRIFDGTTQTVLDTKSIPITIVANTPSIVSIALASTTLQIDGPRVEFTAIFYNPTGTTLSGTLYQELVEQGSVSHGAGGAVVTCGAPLGDFPPGACSVTFTVGASNSSGAGTLVPGAATFTLELRQSSTLLDTRSVPVTLTAP